jgi:thiol-disulfide isomerase/thioredoxin
MFKMKRSLLILVAIAASAVVIYAFARGTHVTVNSGASLPPDTPASADGAVDADNGRDVFISARHARPAPELAAGTWINSDALSIEKLRGRVVLVDFWTFGCYNCRNTLPSLKRWDAAYRQQGLMIVGVHSPEFDREKVLANVQREVRSLGINYPVVTDNDYNSWRAFNIEAWPTVVLLDKEGRVRWTHIGEGMYDETENAIKKLLAEEVK